MKSLSPMIVLAATVGLTSAVRGDDFFFRPDNDFFKAEFEDDRLKFEVGYEKLEMPDIQSILVSSAERDGESAHQIQLSIQRGETMPDVMPMLKIGDKVYAEEISIIRPDDARFASSIVIRIGDYNEAESAAWRLADFLSPETLAIYRSDDEPPREFHQNLQPTLKKLDILINRSTPDDMAELFLKEGQRKDSLAAVLKKLKDATRDQPLARIFADLEFPEVGDSYKLGGHDKELGHIHIDFEKHRGMWELSKIWECR